jgi:probable F420-dependent oxidoreductase
MAQRAEDVGFDSFWLPDHLLFRFPRVHQQGAWDVWSLLAAVAATTERIEIAPLVACTSFRNPALIAKMADTIDEISGGRLILGLGAGWHEPEYAAFGFPYDHRVSRFEEAIQIITALLRRGHVDFEGAYYTARDCELRPRGPRPEGPPILVGGNGERMLRLTARYADAWNADRQNDVAAVQALNERVDDACRDVGRDPATLARIIGIQVDLLNETRQPMQPRQWVKNPWPLTGTPEDLAAQIREYANARVEHMMVWVDPVSVAGIEAFAPVLEALDRAE